MNEWTEEQRAACGYPRNVTSIDKDKLLARAVKAAQPHFGNAGPRWSAVMDAFGLGSTFAVDLCRIYGVDPEEIVVNPCPACQEAEDDYPGEREDDRFIKEMRSEIGAYFPS